MTKPIQFLLLLLLISLDQLAKSLAQTFFSPPIQIIPNFFSLTLDYNTGIAFSIPIPFELILTLNLFLLIFLPIFIQKSVPPSNFRTISIIFIISGAIGNLYDRLTLGKVVDFLSFANFPIFNLADSYLTIAVFILIIFSGKINGLKQANSKPENATTIRT